ncbi:MAG: hypothetical protein ACRBBQ_12320 [Cognatishimia sp.]
MAHEAWYKHYKDDPEEKIGRYLEGVFDEKVLVVLPRIHWAYVDWIAVNLKVDVPTFFKQCETHPLTEEERHEVYQNTLYKNYLQCEKAGLKRPPFLGAATKEEIEAFEERFSVKVDETELFRNV